MSKLSELCVLTGIDRSETGPLVSAEHVLQNARLDLSRPWTRGADAPLGDLPIKLWKKLDTIELLGTSTVWVWAESEAIRKFGLWVMDYHPRDTLLIDPVSGGYLQNRSDVLDAFVIDNQPAKLGDANMSEEFSEIEKSVQAAVGHVGGQVTPANLSDARHLTALQWNFARKGRLFTIYLTSMFGEWSLIAATATHRDVETYFDSMGLSHELTGDELFSTEDLKRANRLNAPDAYVEWRQGEGTRRQGTEAGAHHPLFMDVVEWVTRWATLE